MSKKDFWDGYVPEPIYTFTPSEPIIAAFDMKPNHNMTFLNQDGKQVGELNFNGPEMVFTGDADESAKVFFDFIASAFKARLEQERADEREVCAYKAGIALLGADRGLANRVDQAIRAWSNT